MSTVKVNLPRHQNVLIVWLDEHIDPSTDDTHNSIMQLRRTVNEINTFTDTDQCIQFMKMINNEKICMIISGALGQHVVPKIHMMSQIDSIFVFCGDKTRHERWAAKCLKIKGIFTDIVPICEAIRLAVRQCEENAAPISFFSLDDSISTKNVDQLDPSFMYSQILKEVLLTIQFERKHFREFIEHCRQFYGDNEAELSIINNMEREYSADQSIWWYSKECFLYGMLNYALRMMNVDTIIKMGFFINDLHFRIEQLQKEQNATNQMRETFVVYRGQGMSNSDFNRMQKIQGGLLSFNSFLSTSRERDVALKFVDRVRNNPDLVCILFVMTIHPSQSTTPFASVSGLSRFGVQEDEILFSMHTVFRIRTIRSISSNNRQFEVHLTLTNESDNDLVQLADHIRKRISCGDEGWHRLGILLLKMGQFIKAEQIYETILADAKNDKEKVSIYHQLGVIQHEKKDYVQALVSYKKAVEIYKKTLPSNHPTLASIYNNIAIVFEDMQEYSHALATYEKALRIQEATLSSTDIHLGRSYSNIGTLYVKMNENKKGLGYLQKHLDICLRALPPTHPEIASCYFNMGVIYDNMKDYSEAHSFYKRALDIAQRALPADHTDLERYRRKFESVQKKI